MNEHDDFREENERLRFALLQARCALEVARESSDVNAASAARHALQATALAALPDPGK